MTVFGVASTLGRAVGRAIGFGFAGRLSAVQGGTGLLHVESRGGCHLGKSRHGRALRRIGKWVQITPERNGSCESN
ncbi:hypothetical protein IG631_06859 [Alternaria alternata]|nr:hypothetical protein IG631_06859 [Alternaria alternata]